MKRKDQLIGSEKERPVVKGNEFIPVSVQLLSLIIAVVLFSGWEMPKRTAQTKHLSPLVFYYNISFLTIPSLLPFTGFLAKSPQKKNIFL